MAKQVKNVSTVTAGDNIFQVATRPIFSGSKVEASEIVKTMVTSVELGPNKDLSTRLLNGKHLVSTEGKLSHKVGDVMFDEEDAIIVWNQSLEENKKLATKLIDEAAKALADAREDLKVITDIQKVAEKVAVTNSANYDKEGKIKDLIITKA